MAVTKEDLIKLKKKHGIDPVDVSVKVLNMIRELEHEYVNDYLDRGLTLMGDGRVTSFEEDVEHELRDYKTLTEAILVIKNFVMEDFED